MSLISQSYFHRQLDWPWIPVLRDIFALFEPGHFFPYHLLIGASLLTTIGIGFLIYFGYNRFRISYLILILGISLMNLTYTREVVPHTISGIRYMGGLFPVAQILAVSLLTLKDRPWLQKLVVGGQISLFAVFSYLFGMKVFFLG